MFQKLYLVLSLLSSTAQASMSNELALHQIHKKCEKNQGCISVVTKLFKLERFICGENITLEDFVFNPKHNEYFLAFNSKGLTGSDVWEFYKEECNEDFYTYLDYILN